MRLDESENQRIFSRRQHAMIHADSPDLDLETGVTCSGLWTVQLESRVFVFTSACTPE